MKRPFHDIFGLPFTFASIKNWSSAGFEPTYFFLIPNRAYIPWAKWHSTLRQYEFDVMEIFSEISQFAGLEKATTIVCIFHESAD